MEVPTTAERIEQRATQPTEINKWIDGCTKVCAFPRKEKDHVCF